jgi:hypothetical protein
MSKKTPAASLGLALAAALSTAAAAAELSFDLPVEAGRLPEAMRLVRVYEGDKVTLRWSSNRPLIVHLHGYDIERRIAPGAAGDMVFTAYATGRFPIEIHGAGGAHHDAPLAVIEVYPR